MTENRQFQLLRLASVLSFLFAIVNHLLPPKAFAATQLLFDYEFGLIRRGLFGELLQLLTSSPVSVSFIYAVAAGISVFGAVAFYLFLRRSLPQQISSYLLVILALNSFAFASFVGNSGYLDGLLLALVLVSFSFDGRSVAGLVLRLVVVVIGVLLHENMLPYFTVLIGFELWLNRRNLIVAASPVVAGFVVVGLLAVFTGLGPEQAESFASHLQSKASFKLDANSTDVAGRSIRDNFSLMSEMRASTKYRAWILFDGLPLLAMALWLLWLAKQVMGEVGHLGKIILAGAVLAPLSLNIIAFDVIRFGVASVLCGFVAIALLLRHDPDAAKRLEQNLSLPVFAILMVLNSNIFTLQVSESAGHTSQFPWVLLNQLQWLTN